VDSYLAEQSFPRSFCLLLRNKNVGEADYFRRPGGNRSRNDLVFFVSRYDADASIM
jgi:hypothetical protein